MKIILIIMSILILSSCSESDVKYPVYNYTVGEIYPDSCKIKAANWIKETVAATNFKMSGGDYEDPEDVIEQCEETAQKLFSIKVEGLIKTSYSGSYGIFIPKNELTKYELHILDSLKNNY
jgi:hypothetical protein